MSGYRKPVGVLTKQQRLQQEFEAPWLRLLRSFSDVDVEDLAGGEAALNSVLRKLEILEADARQSEQQSGAQQDALNAAGQSCSQFQAFYLPFYLLRALPCQKCYLTGGLLTKAKLGCTFGLSNSVTCIAETANSAARQQLSQLQKDFATYEARKADEESKLTAQYAALQVR